MKMITTWKTVWSDEKFGHELSVPSGGDVTLKIMEKGEISRYITMERSSFDALSKLMTVAAVELKRRGSKDYVPSGMSKVTEEDVTPYEMEELIKI
jgi:hypothetical protein